MTKNHFAPKLVVNLNWNLVVNLTEYYTLVLDIQKTKIDKQEPPIIPDMSKILSF